MSVGATALWPIAAPATWPPAPVEMTVSALREIEACPRRWALASASYPSVWSGRGYPQRLHIASLDGVVVHAVVEEITRALVRAGCPSVHDPLAVAAMRQLGGYTRVVMECIDRVLRRHADNPRVAPSIAHASRSLRDRAAEIRTRAQALLARVRLVATAAVRSRRAAGTRSSRSALGTGSFAEVELRAERMSWKGKVDLLVVAPDGPEIVDFKTGGQDDEHHLMQVRAYALLWSRDHELNPGSVLASRLVLAYVGHDREVVPPTASELDVLEDELVKRTRKARDDVAQVPPAARPSTEQCRYCSVRQMCDDYWMAEARRAVPIERAFVDAELEIVGRHGPTSWDATVAVCQEREPGSSVVLRAPTDLNLNTHDRLRILDVRLTRDPDDAASPLVLTLGRFSEIYTLSVP